MSASVIISVAMRHYRLPVSLYKAVRCDTTVHYITSTYKMPQLGNPAIKAINNLPSTRPRRSPDAIHYARSRRSANLNILGRKLALGFGFKLGQETDELRAALFEDGLWSDKSVSLDFDKEVGLERVWDLCTGRMIPAAWKETGWISSVDCVKELPRVNVRAKHVSQRMICFTTLMVAAVRILL